MKTRAAYIVGGQRPPFVKSMTNYNDVTEQDLMTASLAAVANKFGLKDKVVGDVGIGATIKSSLDWDFGRECVLGSGMDPHTPGYGVQRACGSSLETTLQIAHKIMLNQIDIGIAGGVDTNSDLPIVVGRSMTHKLLRLHGAKTLWDKIKILAALRPHDLKLKAPSVKEPRTGLSMGEHCEKMVKEWKITREAQDELAVESHKNAAKAYDEGFYDDLVFEFQGIKKDTIIRPDTTLEKLSKLKPAFDHSGAGTLTAGNSTPLSDGSSAVLLATEEEAKRRNWPLLARFVDSEVAAVDFVHGEGLLMAPTIAVARMIARNNMQLQDFDFYEIHEAFAGQVLCTLKAWEDADYCQRVLGLDQPLGSIDRSKLNVKGGSLAIGHPFAATGSRIVAGLAKILSQNKKGRGLISICTAGGMGVTVILEAV
jgi:acetyl-CoA C-acetyltransferase